MKFKSKIIEIEAMQFDGSGDSARDIVLWSNSKVEAFSGFLRMDTFNGRATAAKNDWVIKNNHGEFYPCRDDIFRQKYEPARD